MIAELDTGQVIVLGDGSRPEADSDQREVRAALIRLLLLGGVEANGEVRLPGARLLSAARVGHPYDAEASRAGTRAAHARPLPVWRDHRRAEGGRAPPWFRNPDDAAWRGRLARSFHITVGRALSLLAVAGFSGLVKSY